MCGRCREKKHAPRTPVGEGGKERRIKKGRRKRGPKSRHSMWEVPINQKKKETHAAITPAGEEGNERWDRGFTFTR